LIAQFPEKLYVAFGENPYTLKNVLVSMPECKIAYVSGRKVHFTLRDENNAETITRKLSHMGIEAQIEKIVPGIEDCFIYYMQPE